MKIEMVSIDVLLNRWGRWAIRCESGALGFAASCSLGGGDMRENVDGLPSSRPPLDVIDDDMEIVDHAVRQLPDHLKRIVMQVYQWGQGKSDRKNADKLRMDRKTMCKYINQAHRKIALDISEQCPQNHVQSSNLDSCLQTNKPVLAHA